jgi:hypothetical protein
MCRQLFSTAPRFERTDFVVRNSIEHLDQSKFEERLLDEASVLAPSIDLRELPRQPDPFAVIEDGAARRERQCSALAGERERSTDIFSVTKSTTKHECTWSHTIRY